MMNSNYSVKAGDNLWNIVKNSYGLSDSAAIANKVNQIARANNIQNPDLIFEGQQISLVAGDDFSSQQQIRQGQGQYGSRTMYSSDTSQTNVANFKTWASNIENYKNPNNEFQMFNYNPNTYATDLLNFSQQVIAQFDADRDGKLSLQEYTQMLTNGAQLSSENQAKVQQEFLGLNLDNDNANVSLTELATQFMVDDLDFNSKTLDGKFKFSEFRGRALTPQAQESSGLKQFKQNFFNTLNNFLSGRSQ